MHTHILRKGLISAVIGCSMSFVASAELVLVVHPSNDASLDAKTAQRIFLGKESKFSNGKEAIPINHRIRLIEHHSIPIHLAAVQLKSLLIGQN